MTTLDADKVRNGERVTLDFLNQRGYGLAYEVDGELYSSPGTMPFAAKVDEDMGGGFEVIRDGGERYDAAYNLDTDGMNVREGSPAAEGR